MVIAFIGGPYDGLQLPPIEVEARVAMRTVNTLRGLRKFGQVLASKDATDLPPGRSEPGDGWLFHMYELVNTVHGSEFQYDPGRRRYREALAESI